MGAHLLCRTAPAGPGAQPAPLLVRGWVGGWGRGWVGMHPWRGKQGAPVLGFTARTWPRGRQAPPVCVAASSMHSKLPKLLPGLPSLPPSSPVPPQVGIRGRSGLQLWLQPRRLWRFRGRRSCRHRFWQRRRHELRHPHREGEGSLLGTQDVAAHAASSCCMQVRTPAVDPQRRRLPAPSAPFLSLDTHLLPACHPCSAPSPDLRDRPFKCSTPEEPSSLRSAS